MVGASAALWSVLGDLAHLQGDHRRAIARYSQVLAHHPRSLSALLARAVARCRSGEVRGLEDLHAAIKFHPTSYRAYYYRWHLRRGFGDPAAEADLQMARSLAGPCERFWLEWMAGQAATGP